MADMQEELKNTKQQIDKIKEEMKKALDISFVEDIMKDNVIEYEVKGMKYRLSKPTFKQKQETYLKRAEKQLEFLKDDKFVPEDILIKLYKKKGIDVNEIDRDMLLLEKQKNDLQLKLGEALNKKEADSVLETYKVEIDKIIDLQQELSIKKTKLLEFSIENQINLFTYSYLTYLITEKFVEDKWIKCWNSFEEYQNSDEELINATAVRASLLIQPSNFLT